MDSNEHKNLTNRRGELARKRVWTLRAISEKLVSVLTVLLDTYGEDSLFTFAFQSNPDPRVTTISLEVISPDVIKSLDQSEKDQDEIERIDDSIRQQAGNPIEHMLKDLGINVTQTDQHGVPIGTPYSKEK